MLVPELVLHTEVCLGLATYLRVMQPAKSFGFLLKKILEQGTGTVRTACSDPCCCLCLVFSGSTEARGKEPVV